MILINADSLRRFSQLLLLLRAHGDLRLISLLCSQHLCLMAVNFSRRFLCITSSRLSDSGRARTRTSAERRKSNGDWGYRGPKPPSIFIAFFSPHFPGSIALVNSNLFSASYSKAFFVLRSSMLRNQFITRPSCFTVVLIITSFLSLLSISSNPSDCLSSNISNVHFSFANLSHKTTDLSVDKQRKQYHGFAVGLAENWGLWQLGGGGERGTLRKGYHAIVVCYVAGCKSHLSHLKLKICILRDLLQFVLRQNASLSSCTWKII